MAKEKYKKFVFTRCICVLDTFPRRTLLPGWQLGLLKEKGAISTRCLTGHRHFHMAKLEERSEDVSSPGRNLHQPLHGRVYVVVRDGRVHRELEQLAHRERGHATLAKVVVDMLAVLPQEIQGLGVIQVHGLQGSAYYNLLDENAFKKA